MYDPLRAKAKVALFTGAAFLVGVGVTAALGWTQTAPGPVIDEKPALSLEMVKPAADLSEAMVHLADVVTPAVVRIQSRRPASARTAQDDSPLRFFGGPQQPPEPNDDPQPDFSGGSGFIISADGYIMTNHHVVEDADQITVFLRDRRYFDAHVIGSDPFTDVAVIKIDVAGKLPYLPFGDSEGVQVGQFVLAVGNPGFGSGNQLDYTVTQGIVSARGRGLNILQRELFQRYGRDEATRNFPQYAIEDFIQTDAVINPGNSGGPMVNLMGQVVGINSAIATDNGYYQGYGFAIPINLARHVMEDIVAYGQVRRPLIGVAMQTVTAEDAEYYGLPTIAGALVQALTPRGPAESAGVHAGDVITAVDGKPIGYSGQLQQRIAEHHPGDRVTLTLYRDKKLMQLPVTLGDAPINAALVRKAEPTRQAEERLGLSVDVLDADAAEEYDFPAAGGVVITDVDGGSAAEQRGLVEGLKVLQIDGKAMNTPEDVRRALDAVPAGRVVSLLLQAPTGDRNIVNIRMPSR
jgi:serine protease Do